MKNLIALLLMLLLCIYSQTCDGTRAIDAQNIECCYKFTRVKLPFRLIRTYRRTSSDCSAEAVIFEMVAGKTFCVKPDWDWVKAHLRKLNQQNPANPANPHSLETDFVRTL